jgi:hypothetical protein
MIITWAVAKGYIGLQEARRMECEIVGSEVARTARVDGREHGP